jgi:muramidase (phage lysozyme)
MEGDSEVKGEGNSVNYKYRMHDPRIGRFFTVDPLASKYPHNSPYAFSENRVIDGVELEGLEFYYSADGTLLGSIGGSSQVRLVSDAGIKEATKHINWANDPSEHGKKYAANNTKKVNELSTDVGVTNEELNARAFLSVIRKGEGTSGDKGYTKLFGGGTFENSENHPNKVVKSGKYSSSAAGAYQILYRTWNGDAAKKAKNTLDIGDFSPESQDKFAIWLIDNRGALNLIIKGDLVGAIRKTNKEWASLPESPYGQPTQTMEGAESEFKKAISNELNGKSEIATPQGELKTTIDKLK